MSSQHFGQVSFRVKGFAEYVIFTLKNAKNGLYRDFSVFEQHKIDRLPPKSDHSSRRGGILPASAQTLDKPVDWSHLDTRHCCPTKHIPLYTFFTDK